MKLEVNEYYLNSSGEIVKIEIYDSFHYWRDSNCNSYSYKGEYLGVHRGQYDLIAHIPKTLHYDLLKRIEAYHTNDSYKIYCDKNLGK